MVSTISAKINDTDKISFENVLNSIGLNISSAINAFVKATIREQGIPFALKVDDGFYSEVNQKYLEEQAKLYNEGKLKKVTMTMEQLEEMAK